MVVQRLWSLINGNGAEELRSASTGCEAFMRLCMDSGEGMSAQGPES